MLDDRATETMLLTHGPSVRIRRIVAPALMLLAALPALAQQHSPSTSVAKERQFKLDDKPWKGDFDGMLERRSIRFLIPYSRTLFYVDKGRERGVTAELARDLER